MSDQLHVFGDDQLQVKVSDHGAELQSIRHARFGELQWDGGPAWPRRAPVLFPIIGKLNDATLRLPDGSTRHMGQHGFARDMKWRWLERGDAACTLALEDDDSTRAIYPWPFRLEVTYAVTDGALSARFTLTNPGEDTLPASLGAHPAFRWPLSPDVAPDDHRVVFAEPQGPTVRRLTKAGAIDPEPKPSPIDGRVLQVNRALFADDAIILDKPVGRALRYEAPGAVALEIAWDGFVELGMWTKPQAGAFLCVEPWHGFADPEGFDGPFTDKPGLMHLAPGETRELSWSMRPVAA